MNSMGENQLLGSERSAPREKLLWSEIIRLRGGPPALADLIAQITDNGINKAATKFILLVASNEANTRIRLHS